MNIFKKGYVFTVPIIDFNDPEVIEIMTNCILEQEKILERKKVDMEYLRNTHITI